MCDYIITIKVISINETVINEMLILLKKVYLEYFYHEL